MKAKSERHQKNEILLSPSNGAATDRRVEKPALIQGLAGTKVSKIHCSLTVAPASRPFCSRPFCRRLTADRRQPYGVFNYNYNPLIKLAHFDDLIHWRADGRS
jgi:hypothetical protein